MSKFKKLLSGIIVTTILLSALTTTSFAAPSSRDFVVENGVLTEYNGTASKVIIPDNLGIKKIGYAAFQHKNTMTLVKVPEGVTEIGESAFQNSNNLTSVELPSTLKVINFSAFAFCNKLVSIKLPNSLTELGGYAFFGCESLCSLAVPDGVTVIGYCTFGDCPNLSRLLIPSSVFYISNDAFLDDHNDYKVNTNPTIYVEKNSFAEFEMKKLGKKYATLNTIEKTCKQRTSVTTQAVTVYLDGKPTKFVGFNIAGINYFNVFDVKNALDNSNSKHFNYSLYFYPYACNNFRSLGCFMNFSAEKYSSNKNDANFYGVNAGNTLTVGATVSAMPQSFWYSTTSADKTIPGYIVNNCLYMRIRDIADQVGFTVSWNNNKKATSIDTSTIKAEDLNVSGFSHNASVYSKNNHTELSVTIYKVGDKYYANLRDLADLFRQNGEVNFNIKYDNNTKRTNIVKNEIYIPNGKEHAKISSNFPRDQITTSKLSFNGVETDVVLYGINGASYIYSDDLAKLLNVYDALKGDGSGYQSWFRADLPYDYISPQY